MFQCDAPLYDFYVFLEGKTMPVLICSRNEGFNAVTITLIMWSRCEAQNCSPVTKNDKPCLPVLFSSVRLDLFFMLFETNFIQASYVPKTSSDFVRSRFEFDLVILFFMKQHFQ